MAFVYLIRSGHWLKVGYTIDVDRRYLEYLQHNPEASLLAWIKDAIEDDEKALLGYLSELDPQEVNGREWFRFENIERTVEQVFRWMKAIEGGKVEVIDGWTFETPYVYAFEAELLYNGEDLLDDSRLKEALCLGFEEAAKYYYYIGHNALSSLLYQNRLNIDKRIRTIKRHALERLEALRNHCPIPKKESLIVKWIYAKYNDDNALLADSYHTELIGKTSHKELIRISKSRENAYDEYFQVIYVLRSLGLTKNELNKVCGFIAEFAPKNFFSDSKDIWFFVEDIV